MSPEFPAGKVERDMPVKELRAELTYRGLPTDGARSVLCKRLQSKFQSPTCRCSFTSSSGKQVLTVLCHGHLVVQSECDLCIGVNQATRRKDVKAEAAKAKSEGTISLGASGKPRIFQCPHEGSPSEFACGECAAAAHADGEACKNPYCKKCAADAHAAGKARTPPARKKSALRLGTVALMRKASRTRNVAIHTALWDATGALTTPVLPLSAASHAVGAKPMQGTTRSPGR